MAIPQEPELRAPRDPTPVLPVKNKGVEGHGVGRVAVGHAPVASDRPSADGIRRAISNAVTTTAPLSANVLSRRAWPMHDIVKKPGDTAEAISSDETTRGARPVHRSRPVTSASVLKTPVQRREAPTGRAAHRGDAVQRKIKVGKKAIKKNGKLPPVPKAVSDAYQPGLADRVGEVAREWRDDGTARTYATDQLLYQAIYDQLITQGKAPAPGKDKDPWKTLAYEVQQDGGLRDLPWAAFGANGAAFGNELADCKVQVSSNPLTTACHGNTHNKLPKKVQDMSEMTKKQQGAATPYFEFLIPGHKSDNGIERGVLDNVSGQIYLTAHYDKGSFVWLSGAPAALVTNWQAKVAAYVALLT